MFPVHRFRVQASSGEPIYQQLRRQIKHAVATRSLTEGDRLPPVRELADDLGVNPNTVARAYRELEQDGVLVTTRGRGTFVQARNETLSRRDRERRLRPFVEQLIAEGRALGFEPPEIEELVRRTVAGIRPRERKR